MTTRNPFSRSGIFSSISEELDPPQEHLEVARRRYEDFGAWMASTASSSRDVRIYAQGSYALGTTNRDPVTDKFDFDLVYCVEVRKSNISQERLNEDLGRGLLRYVIERQLEGGDLAPTDRDKGKRAWTLEYSDGFHMDILPVVPDLDGEIRATDGEPSWLTDINMVPWQPTNPKGFAKHFYTVSHDERIVIAKRAQVDVEDLPPEGGPKTTLQMAVKIAKRHRDIAFVDRDPALAPPSGLITALMTEAYRKATPSGGELADVLEAVTDIMPDLLGEVDGELVVPNPTCPKENYADRYAERTDKKRALLEWLDNLGSDFDQIGAATGSARVFESIDRAFGEGFGTRVAKRLGSTVSDAKEKGLLRSNAAGTLAVGSASGTSHRRHTFHGDDYVEGSP